MELLKLKCVVISKARDGSTSIFRLFQEYYKSNGLDLTKIGYVSDTFDLWPKIISYIENPDPQHLHEIFEKWDTDIEISHGMSFIIPALISYYGPEVKIIYVEREIKKHINSLVNRAYTDPQHWFGYSDPDLFKNYDLVPRPTAVHFGEIDKITWRSLKVDTKFEWFLNKQEELFQSHKDLFKNILTIKTENLSSSETIDNIFDFVFEKSEGKRPNSIHVHRNFNYQAPGKNLENNLRIEKFWEQIDFNRFILDHDYAIDIFCKDLIYRFPNFDENLKELHKKIQNFKSQSKVGN